MFFNGIANDAEDVFYVYRNSCAKWGSFVQKRGKSCFIFCAFPGQISGEVREDVDLALNAGALLSVFVTDCNRPTYPQPSSSVAFLRFQLLVA